MQAANAHCAARSRSPPLQRLNWPRGVVIGGDHAGRHLPAAVPDFYQSFLNAPFFMPMREFGFDSYRFIFDDPDFAMAFKNGLMLALGLTVIAVPLGDVLAACRCFAGCRAAAGWRPCCWCRSLCVRRW